MATLFLGNKGLTHNLSQYCLSKRGVHHSMTSVKICGGERYGEICDSQHPATPFPWAKERKQKVIPIDESYNSHFGNHWGPRNDTACVLVVPCPRQLPR